jgi:hypothetical protein
VIKSARSKTFRCLDMAGMLMENGAVNSVTVASLWASMARISRRVGSANAPKITLSRSSDNRLTTLLFKDYVKSTAARATRQEQPPGWCEPEVEVVGASLTKVTPFI